MTIAVKGVDFEGDTLVRPETELEQITLTDVVPYEETNDPNARTHIVNPPMNGHIQQGVFMTAQEIVNKARFLGLEVVALCGYRWVPKHNPEKYDACEACMKIAGILMNQEGE